MNIKEISEQRPEGARGGGACELSLARASGGGFGTRTLRAWAPRKTTRFILGESPRRAMFSFAISAWVDASSGVLLPNSNGSRAWCASYRYPFSLGRAAQVGLRLDQKHEI